MECSRHHHSCPKFKTEKLPRLFYFEEGCDAWIEVPVSTGSLLDVLDLEHNDVIALRFKRKDLTDEEIQNLPED